MRVGIDARLLEREMTGIGRFLAGVLDLITQLDKENEYYLFSFEKLENYEKKGFKVVPTGKNKLIPDFLYSPFWLNFVLPSYLKKHKIDIFFFPSSFLPLGEKKYKALIALCDVFHKIDKDFHSFLYRKYTDLFLTTALKKSQLILTISQNSKRDILKFYQIPEEKVKVVYLAADKIFHPRQLLVEEQKRVKNKYGLPEKFILHVGVLEERKNIKGIIEIADLLKKETDVPILLFGKVGHNSQKYLSEIDQRKNIQFKGFAANEDLPLLYNLATILLFPTFYEGFGLPVVEAMQSGLPVVASNTSSLPEIVGREGMVCSPNDYSCFARSIIKLLKDKDFYDSIRENEIERVKNFDWVQTTKIIINLLKSL